MFISEVNVRNQAHKLDWMWVSIYVVIMDWIGLDLRSDQKVQ